MKKRILCSREQSSMVSTWTDHLCIEGTESGKFKLSTCWYEMIGSIYELVPAEELYDEYDEMIIPDEIDGIKVLGLDEDHYVFIDNLVANSESEAFDSTSMEIARSYLTKEGWDSATQGAVWEDIVSTVGGTT